MPHAKSRTEVGEGEEAGRLALHEDGRDVPQAADDGADLRLMTVK